MSRFRDFMRGTLVCVLKDGAVERFMNLCRSRGIYLADIRWASGEVEFAIGLKDYLKIRPIVRKCHSVPHIKKKRGLPFILYRNRRHRAFFGGLMLALCMLFVLSGFVWNIEIEGNYTHTDESLIRFMRSIDVFTGQRKGSVDTAALEEELRLAYEDISWVSARIEGTVLKIELKEGKVLTPDEDEDTPGNIVATQDGVITSIVTRSGTARVAPGDVVQTGDILIEGNVDIYNDDATVKTSHSVHGDGDVYASLTYHCEDYYPAYRTKKVYTGDTKYALALELFGKMYSLGDTSFKRGSFEETSRVTKYRLTPNFYLPFCLYETTGRAYEVSPVRYTEDEMKALGGAVIENKLEKLKGEGAEIIGHHLRTEIEENNYVIRGDIEMIVPIGSFVPAN